MSEQQATLKVDQEFRSLIPPLTSEEYNLLQATMIKEGCRHPLVVWDGTLIDGHNRYMVCKEHHIDFAIEEKTFATREDAVIWICQNQRGRRNITEEQKTYLVGKEYEASQKKRGGNQRQSPPTGENEKLGSHGVSEVIAKSHNVGRRYVENAGAYAKGVDAIAAVSSTAKEKILTGRSGTTKAAVSEARRMDPEKVKDFAHKIESDQLKRPAPDTSTNQQNEPAPTTQVCCRCKQEKPLTEYHPKMKTCKECMKGTQSRAQEGREMQAIADAMINNPNGRITPDSDLGILAASCARFSEVIHLMLPGIDFSQTSQPVIEDAATFNSSQEKATALLRAKKNERTVRDE